MVISLGNALKSIKEDEHWIKKILIGGLIYLVSIIGEAMMQAEGAHIGIIAFGIVLYLIFYAILLGFMVSTTNKKFSSDFVGWTEWSESNLLIKGLKCLICYLVYTIIITILFTILTIIITAVFLIIVGFIGYLINSALHLPSQAMTVLFALVLGTVFTVSCLYLIQFLNVAYLCYCKNFKFHDIMAFKKHFLIIKENQHAAWTLVGKTILYALLFILITIATCISIIGIILLPFICFASFMALVDLCIQYARKIEIERYFV